MEAFESLWNTCRSAIERYVRYRISHPEDAEDVLQEVLSSAVAGYDALRYADRFKPWLLGIARNKCADHLRRKYRHREIPLEDADLHSYTPAHFDALQDNPVLDTLEKLSPQDQQLLRLHYWLELPVHEIASRLNIPPGTVKSRLYHARQRFQAFFPHPPKGEKTMSIVMPKKLPDYTITPINAPPFECRWEELMGWFIVPKLGEKLSWAMYDFPDRIRTESDELTVIGRASVHGLEGVEIEVRTHHPMENNQTGDDDKYVQRSFVAQLTNTHCRILSETHTRNGIKHMYTFLDGDAFLSNWGFGEENCGNEIHLKAKGDIIRTGQKITTAKKPFLLDVVGRYHVTIGGKTYDTICVMDVETYTDCASEQFIDQNGRTVLWRRFNEDHWQYERYGRTWSERLPDSETVYINGKTYVHWYDCITSYIL